MSLTCFLSSIFRNAAASLAAAVAFCVMPVIISMIAPGGVSAWICSLLPASGVSIQASILYAITDFKFLSLLGIPVWTPYAMVGANILEIPLFLFLAVRSYSSIRSAESPADRRQGSSETAHFSSPFRRGT